MEATEKRSPLQMRRLLGTRAGTLSVAAAVMAIAALVLFAFLSQYKSSVRGGTAPTTAFVASSLIPKGTSGQIVINSRLFKATTLPQDKVTGGAIADTSLLAGRVATRDIYPGQQLSAADFASKADPLRGQLSGDQRAMAVSVDTAHGLLGQVRAGDHVDVYVAIGATGARNGDARSVVHTLAQNVLVLGVPSDSGGGIGSATKTGTITLRVTDTQAAQLAFAAQNGSVWFALRPPAGASQNGPSTVDLNSVLAGGN
jgi:Flp pilus assembly protein CpaB